MIWMISFGFLGVQTAFTLQSSQMSRIFQTLGADPHSLGWFFYSAAVGRAFGAADRGLLLRPHLGAALGAAAGCLIFYTARWWR